MAVDSVIPDWADRPRDPSRAPQRSAYAERLVLTVRKPDLYPQDGELGWGPRSLRMSRLWDAALAVTLSHDADAALG